MTTRSSSAIGVVVSTFLALVTAGCSAPVEGDLSIEGPLDDAPLEGAGESEVGTSEDALTGSYAVGTPLQTTAYVNHRTGPSTSYSIMQVIPPGTRVLSGSATPRSGWYGITWNGRTGWIHGDYLKTLSSTPSGSSSSGSSSSPPPSSGGGTVAGVTVSTRGLDQLRRIVPFADANNSGASRGRCFQYVWNYLWRSTYGAIDQYNDAADMPSAEARNFAEYMNRNGNAARWGLQRLSLTNPYDAPRGAIVVVAAGSPGTAHPTAGDIAIAAGGGRFINDGPNMGYGGSRQAFINGRGRVLGIYVPR
jgi:hypothetical protein